MPFLKKDDNYLILNGNFLNKALDPQVPAVLYDASTVAWYDYTDVSTSDVAMWTDRTAYAHNLLQATATQRPKKTFTGILFDGVDDYLKTAGFTFGQPTSVYLVARQMSWYAGGRFFDGQVNDNVLVYQMDSSPKLKAYAGALSTELALPIANYGVIKAVFNGASGKFKINDTEVTGNYGTNPMDGITLGARGTGTSYRGNIEVKEAIFRNSADSAATENEICNYLKVKHGLDYVRPTAEDYLNTDATVAWYDYTDTATLTVTDVSVSRWNDKLGSGRDLTQTLGASQPTLTGTGVLFDGVNDYMRAAFTLAQPTQIYIVYKVVTEVGTPCIFDGYTNSTGLYFMYFNKRYLYSTTNQLIDSNIGNSGMHNIGILLLNGGYSSMKMNAGTPVTTPPLGTNPMNGFILGARGNTIQNSNIEVKEVIIRKRADTNAQSDAIYNYLKSKHGL
jgi:hypothetical protein